MPGSLLQPAVLPLAVAVTMICLGAPAVGGQEEDEPDRPAPTPTTSFRDEIDVVSATPLGRTLAAERAPWSSQAVQREDLSGAAIGAGLERSLAGVHTSSAQGSAHQTDVYFRGFGTSPLLGAAQGLSVFHDGVRVNEIFGDIVQWDLIQQDSLGEIEVVAGAQAGYGVNTLGGALNLRSDDGFRFQRHLFTIGTGSWGGQRAAIRSGRAAGELAYFLSAATFDEEGWRDHSPLSTRQGLAKLSRRGDTGSLDLAIDVVENDLIGNGPAPVQLLRLDRSAIYTYPDETHNRLVFPRLSLEKGLGARDRLFATLHYRASDIDTFNADELDDESNAGFDGANNRSRTEQAGYGFTVELSRLDWLPGADNLFIAGASWENGDADFGSSSELASLTDDRTTLGSGLFDPESLVSVATTVRRSSLYLVDNAPLAAGLTLNVQARYNETRIQLRDRLGTELDGDHEWRRLHPAIGMVWNPRPGAGTLQIFAGLAQSSRTPTPVELTCSDPEDPCRLPNAFVADPPLSDVVTTTLELGARGRLDGGSWNGGAFAARSTDDILFISSGRLTSTGHFTNVDETRRIGIDAGIRRRHGRFDWNASYTWVDATFETPLRVLSPTHPRAVGGEIRVRPGDRIPGIPRHMGKAGASARLGSSRIGTDLRAFSGRVLRGDEGNLLDEVSGFLVTDAWYETPLGRRLTLSVALENLFDRDTETFGVVGDPAQVLGEEFDDPRFLSPGSPRSLRLAVDIAVGKTSRVP